MKLITAKVFTKTLKQIGIRYVFGVPSGSMIDYIQAIHDEAGIEFILTTHEAGAAFMAGVCGRLTGIPGACFATFGPGATNLCTGVGAAFLDRAPLLAFTDEMPDHLRHRVVQMNIDHQALFSPITKYTERLSPKSAQASLLEAAKTACTDLPGPVHLGIPSDISRLSSEYDENAGIKEFTQNHLNAEALEQITGALAQAEKPVLVLGLGAVRKNLKPLINRLVDRLKIPVVLTPMAKGIIKESHPCYAGVLNHALSDDVARIHNKADLILSIGYDPVEINYEDWAGDIPILHVHTCPADIDPNLHHHLVQRTGDINGAIESLLNAGPYNFTWDLETIASTKHQMFRDLEASGPNFGPCRAMEILREMLSQNGILTCDVGAHLHLVGQKWITPDVDSLLMTNGWSSMGFAVPAAIAAKLCRPKRPVVCLCGDGGFLMSAGELATAGRLNLDIKFVILVDHDLSLIRIKQDKKAFSAGYGTTVSTRDLLDTSSFLGLPVLEAADENACKKSLEKAFKIKGPVIVKIIIDPKEYDWLLLRGNRAG